MEELGATPGFVPPLLSTSRQSRLEKAPCLRPTSQRAGERRDYLSRRLHSFPEAEEQDDDDHHEAEQELPLGQADVVDPAALVKVQDSAPAGGGVGGSGEAPSVRVVTTGLSPQAHVRETGCSPASPGRLGPSPAPPSPGPASPLGDFALRAAF